MARAPRGDHWMAKAPAEDTGKRPEDLTAPAVTTVTRMRDVNLRAFEPIAFPQVEPGFTFNANFCRNPMCPNFGPAPAWWRARRLAREALPWTMRTSYRQARGTFLRRMKLSGPRGPLQRRYILAPPLTQVLTPKKCASIWWGNYLKGIFL